MQKVTRCGSCVLWLNSKVANMHCSRLRQAVCPRLKLLQIHVLFELFNMHTSTFSLSSRCQLTSSCCWMLIWSCLMKEVDCVHSMGVASRSSNTLHWQRTVNALYRGGEEMCIRVKLVTEQVDTTDPLLSAASNGQLRLYLHSTLNRTL